MPFKKNQRSILFVSDAATARGDKNRAAALLIVCGGTKTAIFGSIISNVRTAPFQ